MVEIDNLKKENKSLLEENIRLKHVVDYLENLIYKLQKEIKEIKSIPLVSIILEKKEESFLKHVMKMEKPNEEAEKAMAVLRKLVPEHSDDTLLDFIKELANMKILGKPFKEYFKE